jgi:uncharacterized protein
LAAQEGHRDEATPVPPGRRIDSLDALRGLALLGVLAINLEREFRVSIFQQFLAARPREGVDLSIDAFLKAFIDLKAFAVFSLLFGIGVAIQFERLNGNPRRLVLLIRRLLALLGFGLVHLFLIWNGDILTEYAVAGLVVLPFLFAPNWIIGLAAAVVLALYLAMPLLPPPIAFPDNAWLANHVQVANRVYGSGSFTQILTFRFEEARTLLPLHVFIFPRTIGLFLVGVLAWRADIVRNARRHSRQLWRLGALGLMAGLAASASLWLPPELLGELAFPAAAIVLALSYASLVLAAGTVDAGRWLKWAEPVGRMAFTNYIVQSAVLGWIFYGYGLGLFGKIGLAVGLGLVVAVYVGQVLFSRWWLSRFSYGPLEWLWRALMYGQRPPFRKSEPDRGAAGRLGDG